MNVSDPRLFPLFEAAMEARIGARQRQLMAPEGLVGATHPPLGLEVVEASGAHALSSAGGGWILLPSGSNSLAACRRAGLLVPGSPGHRGGQLAHAVGIAHSASLTGLVTSVIVVGHPGDASSGAMHEAINWCAVHALHVVFLLTHGKADTEGPDLAAADPVAGLGHGLGVPCQSGDIFDVPALLALLDAALVQSDPGPTIVSVRIPLRRPYFDAHSTQAGLEAMSRRDPLECLRSLLVAGGSDEATLIEMERRLAAVTHRELSPTHADGRGAGRDGDGSELEPVNT